MEHLPPAASQRTVRAPAVTGSRRRRWQPSWPVDLATTLGPLARGRSDPTIRVRRDEVRLATRMPDGPVRLHLRKTGDEVLAEAWGPGAAQALHGVPGMLGQADDPAGFAADAHPVMAAAFRRYGAGWRVPRTERVLEALVPAILEQRVTGLESRRAWAWLVRRYGQPAPGPANPELLVAPDGPEWARIPSWAWHRAGVDPGRAGTVMAAAARARALESLSQRPPGDACAALRALPGVGGWTAAEVAVRAWGDADAVSFGDYHLAREIGHALTGRRDGDDALLAALLTPWAGHRARAVRMIELHVGHAPRRGPRATITDHRGR